MKKGTYKHLKTTIEKIRLSKLGKKRAPFSEEWKRNMSIALQGNTHTLGYSVSEETKKKISVAVRGEKHPLWGKKHTLESRQKMSESTKGQIAWNKGKKYTAISGSKHWNWKGGVSSENHVLRTSLEAKLWRKAIFERDNYICVFGGKEHGNKLHADHIKEWAKYPELRFAIDNGRTLCESCHIERHRKNFPVIVTQKGVPTETTYLISKKSPYFNI